MERGEDDGEENVVVGGHANDGDTDLVKRMRKCLPEEVAFC